MWNLFKKPVEFRLAGELKAPEFQRNAAKPARERRGLVSIGVIDDEPFQPRQNLENVGYTVALLGDPNNLDAVKPHQIILCDLQGVGQALDRKRQGSFLIREMRLNYPDKYVLAYTGGTMNMGIIRDSQQSADAFLKKDVDIETWTDKLDSIISELVDPYKVWLRQRKALIDREVDTLTVLNLEDAFVKSIVERNKPDDSPLAELARSPQLSGDVRAIIQSLISSAIFKILVG